MRGNQPENDDTYAITIANPGRGGRKFQSTFEVTTTEARKAKKSRQSLEDDLWKEVPEIESNTEIITPEWTLGFLNQGKEPFARFKLKGKRAYLTLDPEETHFDIQILQGLNYKVSLAAVANKNNIPIYTATIVRNTIVVKKRGRPKKIKVNQTVTVKQEKRKQIRLQLVSRKPTAETEFSVENKTLTLFDNKMAETIKVLLEQATGVQWYTGIPANTLVIPLGASDRQVTQAKQIIVGSDIFI